MNTRWKPNVTVVAVIERDDRFLLVEEETSDGLRLNNPAGHLDCGETPEQACTRETLEETAYSFTPSALVGIYLSRQCTGAGGDTTYLRFAFCGTLGDCDPHRKLDTGIVRRLPPTSYYAADSDSPDRRSRDICGETPPPRSVGAVAPDPLPVAPDHPRSTAFDAYAL